MANPPAVYIEALNAFVSDLNRVTNPFWTDLTGNVLSAKVRGLGWQNKRSGDPNLGQLQLVLDNPPTTTNTSTTLNGNINASTTTITPNIIPSPGFTVGMIIQIDSEYMQVTVVGSTTLTVIRAVKNSTAASHSSGAPVYVWNSPYNPRSVPGSYTATSLGNFTYYNLLEVGQFVRIRYAGLNNGYCMKVIGNSTANPPSSGSAQQWITETCANGQVWTLSYQARAQYDYQYNTDSVTVNSATTGTPTTDTTTSTPSYTNKWATYTVALTLTAASATANQMQVTFAPWASVGYGGNRYIEYRNVTLTCPTVSGGANQIANGTFTSGGIGNTPTGWTVTAGSNGMTATVQNDTYTTFYGRIRDIAPQPFTGAATPPHCQVTASTLWEDFQAATLAPPPPVQHNVATGTLMALALSYVFRSWPGQSIAAGQLTPPGTAFDQYTSGKDMVSRAIDQILTSEYGKVLIDRDGTFNFLDRNYEAIRTAITYVPVLTLAEGYPYDMTLSRGVDQVINRVYITFHPRVQIDPINPVFIAQNVPIQIPAKTPTGPGTLTMTVQFHDLYGKPCGVNNVQQLIPWQKGLTIYDYKINEFQAGNGIDYTTNSNVTISMTAGASQATVIFSNNAIGPLWIQFFQVRGQAIVTYDPQVLYLGEGTQAAGSVGVPSQPSDGDTVTTNGVVFTFKTTLTPTAGQVLIGATAAATSANLYAAMTGGTGAGLKYANLTTPAPNTAFYTQQLDSNNTIAITFIETGSQGNNYTLAKTGTAVTVTAGLFGGQSTSKQLYGLQDYNKDLPFADDPLFVQALMSWLIYRFGYPFLEVVQVKVAFEEQLNGVDLMSIEDGDVFAITSVQNGMYNARHMVARIDYDIDPHAGAHPLSSIVFTLFRLDQHPVMIWDEVAGSVWDDGIAVAYI